ncbi:MAG: aminopeptidase [Candidatus Saccharibacteria bacterium]|nr:aminopeptidase [Candidatus Saccharibacteria bacterium]
MTKTVTRLYEQFQPDNYALTLAPDREAMTFTGTVTVTGKKVGRPSERITFHQKGLTISKATVVKHDKKGETEVAVERINNQDSYDEARIHASEQLYPGNYTITLEFSGKITTPMNGIYPCKFEHEGKQKQLIATQFESHFAREAFPCIDEPEAKATFDLTLVNPEGEVAIANTPVKAETMKDGLTTTVFETSPKMSTYLLAFIYGELGYLDAKTKNGVTVRTYATPEHVKNTQFALDTAVKTLEFFEDYFGVPYPLPKLDMAALPDFSAGAMENWGLITYREVAMLYDESSSSIETKQYIAMVVAHEISHQWFGNLVTMKWWDDLWLNESFANMMEYRAVDALYPEWNIWEQFVSHEEASAKRRDSLVDVQAIHTDVNHPDEISTLFDPSIVYAKGGSVLYMLLNYLGEEAFRKGLTDYFGKHAYGNTVADDLWAALGAASSQDVGSFMNGWISRPGFPIVSVNWQPGEADVRLQQQRFLSDPSAKTTDNTPWQVPLAATTELSKPLFDATEATVQEAKGTKALILNHDGHSYFLPQYVNGTHLAAITKAIEGGEVSTIDRLLLLDNYLLLQRGGFTATTDLLDLLSAYKNETSESVWADIAASIAEVRRLIEGDEAAEDKLNTMIATLTQKLVADLGWDDHAEDDASILRMRGLVIAMAAGAKVLAVLEEGAKRFAAFKTPSDLSSSTRSVVYFIAARHGSPADFERLLKLHDNSKSAEERDEYASALTSVQDKERYETVIGRLTGDTIRRQDLMHWFVWLLRNRYSRATAWKWLVDNWGWVEKEFESEKSYGYFPRYAGSIFSRAIELKDFSDFFSPKRNIIALARDITLAEQEIGSRIAWRDRNEEAVKNWLA